MRSKSKLLCCLVLFVASVIHCSADEGVNVGLFRLLPCEDDTSSYSVAMNKDTLIDGVIDTLHVPSVFDVDGRRYEVENISASGFSDCGFFRHLVLDEGIRTIGHHAFSGCSDVVSVTFPSSLVETGFGVVSFCPKLKEMKVDAANPYFDSREYCNAIIRKDGNSLVLGCSGTVIPHSVVAIEKEAFLGCMGLQTLRIPSWMERIDDMAFGYCSSLTTVELPQKGNLHFNFDVFTHCQSLSTVYVSTGRLSFARNPFTYCENLAKFVVAPSCTEWYTDREGSVLMYREGNVLFAGGCGASIPEGTVEIFDEAFAGCRRLTKVYVPSSVMKIAGNAFAGCRNLVSVVVDKNNKKYDSRGGCNCIVETKSNKIVCGSSLAVIPNDIDTIGAYAFCGMDVPNELRLPEHVRYVGDCAFAYCDNLQNLAIASAHLSSSAFFCCANLKSVTYEDGCDVKLADVCPLAKSPFSFCNKLSSIRIHGVNTPSMREGVFVNPPKPMVGAYRNMLLRIAGARF